VDIIGFLVYHCLSKFSQEADFDMRRIADDRTLNDVLWRSSLMLCLLVAGCGSKLAEPVNAKNTSVRTDRYDQAVSELSRTLEKNPQNARAYYERALVYYDKGAYDKARQDARKAQRLGYEVPAEFLRLLSEAPGNPG
jgi:tetratricopeptide (TPR) repeat protein